MNSKYFTLFALLAISTQAISLSVSEFRVIAKHSRQREGLSGIIVEDCGSGGTVSEVRVDGCVTSPCELYPDNYYLIEVDFSTHTNGNVWNVLVTASSGNTNIVVLDENVEAEIEAGEQHMLSYELPVSDLFQGRTIKVKIQLREVNTQIEEICIVADAIVRYPVTEEPSF